MPELQGMTLWIWEWEWECGGSKMLDIRYDGVFSAASGVGVGFAIWGKRGRGGSDTHAAVLEESEKL